MPRFFFDIRTPSRVICYDYQGLECSNTIAALEEARHGARFVTAAECERNPQLASCSFSVSDEAQHRLFEVPLTEVLFGEDLLPPSSGRHRPCSPERQARSSRHV